MRWPADGVSEETKRAIEDFLDDWRVKADIPGVAVALVDTDGTIFATGSGASDIKAREPATPDTRFPYASTTKVITGLTVLQFIERGTFALDDPIPAYVETWSDVPGEPITIRNLLTHSTGMPAALERFLDFLDTADGMELRLSAYRLWRTNLD